LYNEKTKGMSVKELMIQFGLQLTGDVNTTYDVNQGPIDDAIETDNKLDLLDIELDKQLRYDRSPNPSFDTFNDCSGTVQDLISVFLNLGLGKDGITSGSADHQLTYMSNGDVIKKKDIQLEADGSIDLKNHLKFGDVVYYDYDMKGYEEKNSDHVVIYIGNGLVLESSGKNRGVIVNYLNSNKDDIAGYATNFRNTNEE
jgi:hypothetical protein